MKKITEVIRRQIANLFYKEFNYWGDYGGDDEEIKFLERLYNLEKLPSTDGRFKDAKGDICQHRINNWDWQNNNWIFKDEEDRFNLNDGNDDEYLLKFLCETLHPAVREPENVQELLKKYNNILSVDGYKIIEKNRLSNRPVYGFCEINNQIHFSSNILMKPIQKILFGSPGTGKSYQIREIAQQQLNIQIDEITKTSPNIVKAVFHPEYTHADFMGKLLPLTQDNYVMYKFYSGHFLKILGMAYQSLINHKYDNYLLVIDELNRGNSAAIFGNIFQLLDRESDGWSSYEINISEMELLSLLDVMRFKSYIQSGIIHVKENEHSSKTFQTFCQEKINDKEYLSSYKEAWLIFSLLRDCQIKLPPNLSIIATINTSDESIYYLDTAFKRRWDWEFINAPVGEFKEDNVPRELLDVKLVINDQEQEYWYYYIVGINEFIKSNYQTIRRIEDKMIGWWFIKPENNKIELQKVKDKLMFYLWDSVFARDKKPLEIFLSEDENSPVKLALYSDFLGFTERFLEKVYQLGETKYQETSSF